MALRFHLPFTSLSRNSSLPGEAYVVELWDSDFTGAAVEVEGDFQGLRIDWEGKNDTVEPVMASSATYSILIEQESDMALITALAGSREGRFKMVVRRAGQSTVYWAGWVQTDQVSWPDQYFPFHLEIFAVDGISRLGDMDYVQADGTPFTGYTTVMGHLLNIIEKIDIQDVGTWKTDIIRSTAWWYADHMVTTASPLTQANVDYERFLQRDKSGNVDYWNTYAVLAALMQAWNCQFLIAGGRFIIRSIDQYQEATQIAHYFNESGTLVSTSIAEDIDLEVDYTVGDAPKKLAGGRYTFLRPLKKVCVDYKHRSHDNRALGVSWQKNSEDWVTVVTLFNSTPASTQLYINLKVNHLTQLAIVPPGSAAWPTHRYIWSLQVRISKEGGGWLYMERSLINGQITQITTFETEWGTNADNFDIFGVVVNYDKNNQWVTSEFDFSSKYIDGTQVADDATIQMKLELLRIEKLDGTNLAFTGSPYQGNYQWSTDSVWLSITEEAPGLNPDKETLRFCAITPGENTADRYIDTYLGDGPNIFSVSTYKETGGATSGGLTQDWQVNGVGVQRYVSQLLAEKTLQFRKLPQKVFQGAFLYTNIQPWHKFIDQGEGYMATKISLDAFSNIWSGEFILMDGTTDDITLPEPFEPPIREPTPPGGYPSPPPDDEAPDPTNNPTTELMVGGLSGYVAQVLNNMTTITADVVSGSVNPTITIDDLDYAAFKKGDTVTVVHPGTGQYQNMTVSSAYTIGSTSLPLTGTLSFDLPAGSLIKVAKATEMQVRGFTHYERNFTGELWTIPTTVGELPNPTVVGADECRRRVKVYRSGVRLVYDANNFADTFGIKPATNQIEFYIKCRNETVYAEIS